ncbi:hypothetical protein [Encephalitozoon cuniculi GB-M1]|uniref:Uncharacterized protein n=1 Tax=Encephalitozoon cuniculi (strain GB-M1) TaxID=284813 RepID=Q8SVX0_ENCCU|nr:uncharacterized protein ECU04_0370 [Encephalitozoon cuniculi GB-M1]CAD25224.1 hypothetical protein [Encephalitozoon cuniculi GB-M1]
MIDKVDKKSIRKLYLMRGAGEPRLRPPLTKLVGIGNPYLTFVLHAMFHDMLPGIPCPMPFNILMRSTKMASYIVKRLIGKNIAVEVPNRPEKYDGRKCSENDYANVMEFLLNLERTSKKLSLVDQSFVWDVISNISEPRKAELIRFLEISPLSILMMKTMSVGNLTGTHSAVVNLLKAKEMGYKEGFAYIHESNADFRTLKRTFLKSNFAQIQKYFHVLTDFYPEMMFGARKPWASRMQIFRNPLSIPIRPRLLCAYIPASVYFIRRKCKALRPVKNLDVLVKTIYVERILSSHPKKRLLKSVVHQLILDTPVLVKVIVMRGFPCGLVKRMVECVPSFHLAYEISLKMLCKNPADSFHEALVEELLRKYPTEGNIEKFQACSHLFSSHLLDRLRYLIDASS